MTYNEMARCAVRDYMDATGQDPTHIRMGLVELAGLKSEVAGNAGVWVVNHGVPRIYGCEIVIQDNLQGFWPERRG